MLPIFDYIKAGIGVVFGGIVVWLFAITIYAPMVRHEATAKAVAQCEADKSNMVSRAVADALAATLAQERRYRVAADVAASEAEKRASEALRAKEAADAQIEALKAEAKDQPTWTEQEIEWLRAH